MNWDHREPTLNEMLSDSIIRAVMAADGVDPQELAVMLRQIGRSLVRPDQVGVGPLSETSKTMI
jgi:hypothetical protein